MHEKYTNHKKLLGKIFKNIDRTIDYRLQYYRQYLKTLKYADSRV